MIETVPKDGNDLAEIFAAYDIDTNEIAFYNSENFLLAEQENPDMRFLYGHHVNQLAQSKSQLDQNAECIRTLCKILYRFIEDDPQQGTCVDLSCMVSKFLEAYGIWNYCISGSMNLRNPALKLAGNQSYFWALDVGNPIVGHAWVVAPPYEIIDLSLHSQPYTSNEQELVPNYILQKSGNIISATTYDHVSPERRISEWGKPNQLDNKAYYELDSRIKTADEYFPCYEFAVNETTFRYLCCGVAASDAKCISELRGRRWKNMYPLEIFENIVQPQMAKAGFESKLVCPLI